MLTQCDRCGRQARNTLRGEHPSFPPILVNTPSWRRGWHYCPQCIAEMLRPYQQACQGCGALTLICTGPLCRGCASASVRERARIARRLRHAKRRGANGVITPTLWAIICEHFGAICLCCGSTGRLTIDHVMPISLGGRNDVANVQPLCLGCNCRKHTKVIDYRDPDKLADLISRIG